VADQLGAEHILRIDEDTEISINSTESALAKSSKAGHSWGIERVGASLSRIPKRYPRPRVALLGTGITPHPHLRPAQAGINFSGEKGLKDHHGLGTHMAGIIGGYSLGRHKSDFHGIYPFLPLSNVKVFNREGKSSISRVIQGLEWCINHQIGLIIFSFATHQHHPALYEAIKTAHREGIIMAAPCGDEGGLGLKYPARYHEVLAVGSINEQDLISSFSPSGTDLDCVAPGENIYSTSHLGRFQIRSGTAIACAHAGGCLAIMLSLKPDITLDGVRSLLKQTCERLSTSNLLQGSGLISLNGIITHLKSSQSQDHVVQ